LIRELDTIYEHDQEYRVMLDDTSIKNGGSAEGRKRLWKIIQHYDSLDLIKIEAIIKQYGWPGPEVVRDKGTETVWLVIQHSNIEIQEKYLPLLREAVKEGKAKPSNLAYLEDRIAIRRGRKQIYGSQLTCIDGKCTFEPIEDEANVNKRRATVGLEPIEEYARLFGIDYKAQGK
jgi:hypothetical protein